MNYWRRRPSMKPENIKRRMTNRMAKVVAALVIAGVAWAWNNWFGASGPETGVAPQTPTASAPAAKKSQPGKVAGNNAEVERLIAAQGTADNVTVQAVVARLLADDNDGAPHQKFLIDLPSGHRLLVAHNIDLAPRVPDLQVGAPVTVHGEFVWNERGGVMHWTHHDPAGRHAGGWIEYAGHKYQ